MTTLPHVDEIRALRSEARAAEYASHLVIEAEGLMRSLQGLVGLASAEDGAVPGQEILDQAVGQFPFVAPVLEMPGSGLVRRVQQLQAMIQFLTPIANRHGELADRLHHLQHEQAEALQRDEFSDLRQQLSDSHAHKLEATRVVQALSTRVAGLRSLIDVLEPILDAVEAEAGLDPEAGAYHLDVALDSLEPVIAVSAPGWTLRGPPAPIDERVRETKGRLVSLAALLASVESDARQASARIVEAETTMMRHTG